MRDVTVTELEQLAAGIAEAEATFQMDEEAFGCFYERTARPVWAYLARMTGDPRLADDLLQEAYYRFLRARPALDDEAHRRNYLFRIATNLVHDIRRRPHVDETAMPVRGPAETIDGQGGDMAAETVRRIDTARGLAQLKPRERELLWLAYAQGSSHHEIAETLGVKASSVKMLLFRARRRLAAVLRAAER